MSIRSASSVSVIPRSGSSGSVIRRSWSRSSSLTAIGTSDRPFEVVAHERAFGEHTRQQEREQDGEPPVDRKARLDLERMPRYRNGPDDRPNRDAEQLQREQRPRDSLQALRVGCDEGVAGANGIDDREQPFEDGVVHRNADETDHGNRTQA